MRGDFGETQGERARKEDEHGGSRLGRAKLGPSKNYECMLVIYIAVTDYSSTCTCGHEASPVLSLSKRNIILSLV